MPMDTFLWLVLFAFVTSITPGPNNLMLLASGVNFGFVRTIPHMLGIAVGFGSLLVGVGLGLGALLAAWPALAILLKVAGGSYLIYLAWRIARSRAMGSSGSTAQPLTLFQAAAFQWVNPKAWMMSITAMALYTDYRSNPQRRYRSWRSPSSWSIFRAYRCGPGSEPSCAVFLPGRNG